MLKPTVSPSPTRRECVLLAILLFTLLSVSRSTFRVHESLSSHIVPGKTLQKPSVNGLNVASHDRVPTGTSELWRTHTTSSYGWGPQTRVMSHARGWTIFDNLYVFNGTVYVVTNYPELVPARDTITSTGAYVFNGDEAVAALKPTDHDLSIISTDEAEELFGSSADLIDGTTWIVNDPPQFLTHYYHWAAELFFGFWRTYSSLDPSISADGTSVLPAVRRIWFIHADAAHWRDYASLNQYIIRSVFPSITAEYSADWRDRTEMGRPVMLDRVIFTDRPATMKGNGFLDTGRTASEAFTLPGSEYWWSIVRGAVTKFSGLDASVDPMTTPVITYVSRQDWNRRKLIQEDHEKLVAELYKLRDKYGVEVNIVSMDTLTHAEQLHLAARSTIFMGVHGNALTSLVWMVPTPRSSVIEFFYPGGFARDYEYTSGALGMSYYGIWDDRVFTNPEVPPVSYPEGFQGNSIPLDGVAVARLCAEILELGP